MAESLAKCKARLYQALGDDCEKYQDLLRRWFRHSMTKEEFDSEAWELLGKLGAVPLHCRFMLAILAHCQMPRECLAVPSASTPPAAPNVSVGQSTPAPAVATESPSPSVSSHEHQAAEMVQKRHISRIRRRVCHTKGVQEFVRARPYALRARTMRKPGKRLAAAEAASWTPSSQPMLPDIGGLRARLLSHAWSVDLQSVSSEVPELMAIAVEHHLKDVLTAAMSRNQERTGYHDQIALLSPRRSNRVRSSQEPVSVFRTAAMAGGSQHNHVAGKPPLLCEGNVLSKRGQPIGTLAVADLLHAFQVNGRVLRSRHVWMPTVQTLQSCIGRHAPKSFPTRRNKP